MVIRNRKLINCLTIHIFRFEGNEYFSLEKHATIFNIIKNLSIKKEIVF